jgi:hypothetical protein
MEMLREILGWVCIIAILAYLANDLYTRISTHHYFISYRYKLGTEIKYGQVVLDTNFLVVSNEEVNALFTLLRKAVANKENVEEIEEINIFSFRRLP